MSATGRSIARGHVRESDDYYATPGWAVRAILPKLMPRAFAHDVVVLDPCCGKGAILAEARQHFHPNPWGIELNPDRANAARDATNRPAARDRILTADALTMDWPDADLVLMNASFPKTISFLETALAWRHGDREIATLTRLGFLASLERAEFHRQHPADVHILPVRPSFCISVSCRQRRSPTKPCAYTEIFEHGATLPKICPRCGHKLKRTRSDACDYAWLVWGPGRGGRWSVLEVEDTFP
jgi:hypothetical protein